MFGRMCEDWEYHTYPELQVRHSQVTSPYGLRSIFLRHMKRPFRIKHPPDNASSSSLNVRNVMTLFEGKFITTIALY